MQKKHGVEFDISETNEGCFRIETIPPKEVRNQVKCNSKKNNFEERPHFLSEEFNCELSEVRINVVMQEVHCKQESLVSG